MKKRILAIATAAVLALGCFATASAEVGSPDSYKNAAEKKAAKLMDKGLDSDIFTVAGIRVKDYQGATDDWEVKSFAAIWNDDEDQVFYALAHLCAQYPKDTVIRVFDLVADDADKDSPIEVTIADVDIKETKNYALRHMSKKTGEWDSTSAKVTSKKAGLLKAEVTAASPYALVETKSASTTSTAATSKTAATAATGKTAAKTGEV